MNDDPTVSPLESFYQLWESRLFSSIRRRVPHTAAENVAQDVWVAIVHRVGDGPVPDDMVPMMFGIAHHKIADWYRSNVPKTAVPLDPLLAEISQVPDPRPGPGESEPSDVLQDLAQILPRLTPQQRDAVLYRHYVGMSVAEVADAMGVTHNAAKRFLVRGMGNIRSLLIQAGYEIRVSTKEMPQ